MQLKKYIILLCAVAGMAACTEEMAPDVELSAISYQLSAISISAKAEQPADADAQATDGQKRTALSGSTVVWSAGDRMSLLAGGEPELTVTISGQPQGIAINVGTTSNVYIRYSYIRIVIGGEDVTSALTALEDNTGTYNFGIWTTSSTYQYVEPGTPIQPYPNSNYIPILQSSKSMGDFSATKTGTVTFRGLQYSTDGQQTWIDVTEQMLVNGSQWGKNDVASYRWTESQNIPFTLTDGESTTEGTFSGTDPQSSSTCYALYPYDANAGLGDGMLHFSLPEHQTYAEGSFGQGANPMAGLYADGSAEMKNLCGMLCLQLRGTETVTQIRLTDLGDASLWGNATIALTEIGTAGCTATGGSSTVTLDCPEGVTLSPDAPTPFYIAVPAGALAQGFTAEVNTFYGTGTLSTNRDQTVHRAKVRKMSACGLGEIQLEEFCIENPTAHDVMLHSYSTYAAGSSSYLDNSTFRSLRNSAIANGYRNDQPNTKVITFANPDGATVQILMATDAAYENVVLNNTTTGTSYRLRNFVPGKEYYYKVVNGTTLLTAGALRATGQLRMLYIDDSWNLRDLGGWTGWNGNTVRYEQLYRGGSVGGQSYTGSTYSVSDDSKAELQRIGWGAHLDLRSLPNKGLWPTGETSNSHTLGNSVLSFVDFLNICSDNAQYNPFVNSAVIGDMAFIIKELKQGKPVYFHCRTGADRTGAVGMTSLGLLGCDPYPAGNGGNQLAMDYEFTSLALDEEGTLAYLAAAENGTLSTFSYTYSVRYSNVFLTTLQYKIFNNLITLDPEVDGITVSTLQERIYYYLNRYFYDHSVSKAGTPYINKADLDWFINFMLGITDIDGNLINGHSSRFTGPSWALDHSGNTLDTAIGIAVEKQYSSYN